MTRNTLKLYSLTTASVMPRHIPEPPPVQKRTFPLNISGLNTALESMSGATNGFADMNGWKEASAVIRDGGT